MGKTNLDDLDLGRRGIEAAEVNSEAAAAGALLTADGQGGALWSTTAGKTSFAVAFHESEDEVTLGSWYDLHQAPGLYLYTAGWTLDPATGALIVPAEVGSGVAIVTVQVGFLTAGKSGHGLVRVRRAPALSPASFSTVGEGAMPLVDSAVATLRAQAIIEVAPGDAITADFRPVGAPAGSGSLDVVAGWTMVQVVDNGVSVDW